MKPLWRPCRHCNHELNCHKNVLQNAGSSKPNYMKLVGYNETLPCLNLKRSLDEIMNEDGA